MLKFEDLVKTLDPYIRVQLSSPSGNIIYDGKLKDIKNYPDSVLRIIPQSTSREVYLEIYAY